MKSFISTPCPTLLILIHFQHIPILLLSVTDISRLTPIKQHLPDYIVISPVPLILYRYSALLSILVLPPVILPVLLIFFSFRSSYIYSYSSSFRSRHQPPDSHQAAAPRLHRVLPPPHRYRYAQVQVWLIGRSPPTPRGNYR